MKSIRTDPANHAEEGDERIRTAVPAPGDDPVYDHHAHQWVGQCPHGDVCTGCDARGYCTREEGDRDPSPPNSDQIKIALRRLWRHIETCECPTWAVGAHSEESLELIARALLGSGETVAQADPATVSDLAPAGELTDSPPVRRDA